MHPKHAVDVAVGTVLIVVLIFGVLGVYKDAFSATADNAIAVSWIVTFTSYILGRLVGEVR